VLYFCTLPLLLVVAPVDTGKVKVTSAYGFAQFNWGISYLQLLHTDAVKAIKSLYSVRKLSLFTDNHPTEKRSSQRYGVPDGRGGAL
jgi:hypothetical protein